MVKWAKEFLEVDFETDYPTDRESGYGPLTKRWIAQSRNWMKKFLTGLGATEIVWHKMYYEWSMYAKVGNQWWYFNTGDMRFKIMGSLLVRTCTGPADSTGGRNQWVAYNNPAFEDSLKKILGG